MTPTRSRLECLLLSILTTVLVCIWLSSITNAQDYEWIADKSLWEYNLSRYYSMLPWQESYLYGRTYKQELIEQFAGDPDVTMPADWVRYTHDDRMKAVACPPNIKLWSKLYLQPLDWKWPWLVVTCRDRGGAIKGRRIDMYCGVWQDAVNEWNTCVTGRRKVYTMVRWLDAWMVAQDESGTLQPREPQQPQQPRKICRLLRSWKSKSTNVLVDDWNNNWFIDQSIDNKTGKAKIYKCIYLN